MSIIDPDEIQRLNGSWLSDDIDHQETREWAEALKQLSGTAVPRAGCSC
jgi:hypothetical protein